jgi:hypothetical protein
MGARTAAPLNPDGLICKYFGRLPAHRLGNGLRMAMVQNMHPGLAAGVELQAVFLDDPLARGRRSIGPIMSVVDGGATAAHPWPWALHPLLQAPVILVADTLRRHVPPIARQAARYARWQRETWWRNEMGDKQSKFAPGEQLRR